MDSGFISEFPDDLNLLRGTSVESLPGSTSTPESPNHGSPNLGSPSHRSPSHEDRGCVMSSSPPPLTPDVIDIEDVEEEKVEPEVWDEAKVCTYKYN